MSALRWSTRFDEFTVSGGLPAGTVIPIPVAPEPELVLVIWSIFPAFEPVSVVVAFTELTWPRLNTPPTPVPASAVAAVSTRVAVAAPTTTPLPNPLRMRDLLLHLAGPLDVRAVPD
jgi:hypothetical protein